MTKPLTLQTIPLVTFREELANVLNLLTYCEQGFVVTRRGENCAVVLPLSVLEKLGLSLLDLGEYKGKAV